MSNGTHNNVLPASVSCDTEKYTSPSPTSLGPTLVFELQHPQNEPARNNYTEKSNFVDGDSQISDDRTDNSAAEKNTPYLNQISPEQTHESGHVSVLIESSEQECEPIKRDILIPSVDRDQSLVFSNNVNHDNFAQASELPFDINRNSQIDDKRLGDDESYSTLTTRKELNDLPELNHHDDELVKNLQGKISCEVSSHLESDQCQLISQNTAVLFSNKETEFPSDEIEQVEVQQNIMQQTQVEVSEPLSSKLSEKNHLIDDELAQNNPAGVDVSQQFEPHVADCFLDDVLKLPFVNAADSDKQLKASVEDAPQNSSIDVLETPVKRCSKYYKQVSCQASKSRRTKYILRSLCSADRVLRPRTQVKATAPKPSNPVSSVRCEGDGKSRKKKKSRKIEVADEFSKIRSRVKYFINRMSYKQSFIAAYSGEGWKGYSLEKLKPEKELQRATNEILRYKLKIRDLFEHLDSLCVKGRFSESVFDSEGQIDSEDIFCAKCGSEEMSANNDIILCDGACDRGFHQFCLEPPLLNENIPLDDEGWLCPGCDCKVDCIDFLNDSQGTNYSLTDSWENVYPEAAIAASGQSHDQTLGLPSDDSDDNDFNPDDPETDEQGDASSSDVSENNLESETLDALPEENQYLGLPSDDSEDDDYNPEAPDTEEKIKSESSSSDFTSDSENLAAIVEDDRPSKNETEAVSSSPNSTNYLRRSDKKRYKHRRGKQPLKDELSSILELGPFNGLSPIASRRHAERLDYKKLHDETYGNVSSDSSDDENWGDIPAQRKKSCGIISSAERKGTSPVVKKVDDVLGKNDVNESEITPKRSTRRTRNVEDSNNSLIKAQEGSFNSGSTGGKSKSSAYNRLGEAVIQRLHLSFKENQYPEKQKKESLAQELGLSFKQVAKWFDNTRWSTHHPSPRAKANAIINQTESSLQKGTQLSHPRRKLKPELDTTEKSRKRKGRSVDLATDPDVSIIKIQKPLSGSSKTHEDQANSRVKTRKQISIVAKTDVSIKMKSSKADEDRENIRVRTRKQKMAAANIDDSVKKTRKLLGESSKADEDEDEENTRIRTRSRKPTA